MILCWRIVALHCCLCLLCCKVNQLRVCTYPLLFGFPSQSGVHRAMTWVACARYTVGSHWLSVLYTVVCIRQPQSPHLAHSALFPVVSMFVPYICVSISSGSFSFELCPVTTQHVVDKATQTPFRMAARGSDRTGSRSHSAQLTWTHTVAPDALLDEVCSHGLGEADHGCLGCAVYTPVHNSWEGKKGSVAQPCPTLCGPVDCSPPGSSVHGLLQARRLEWVAMPSSRGSSWSRDGNWASCTAGGRFATQPAVHIIPEKEGKKK